MAAKLEIISYKVCTDTKRYLAKLRFTLHDDFGLDRQDILRQSPIVNSLVGPYFRDWYVLQHWRCHQPFITEVIIEKEISGYEN
jgi:hypothetical protein